MMESFDIFYATRRQIAPCRHEIIAAKVDTLGRFNWFHLRDWGGKVRWGQIARSQAGFIIAEDKKVFDEC